MRFDIFGIFGSVSLGPLIRLAIVLAIVLTAPRSVADQVDIS